MKKELMKEIKVGMEVIGLKDNDYEGLVGRISAVRVGEDKEILENDGQEIVVNFYDTGDLDITHEHLNGTSVEQVFMNEYMLGFVFDNISYFTIDGDIVCKKCLKTNKDGKLINIISKNNIVYCVNCLNKLGKAKDLSEFLKPVKEIKTYLIPATWMEHGMFKVDATSLEEAEEMVRGDAPLPDGDYLCDSIVLDKESPDYGKVIS